MNRSHFQISVLTVSLVSAGFIQPIAAQIVPDTTLPTEERSQVSGDPSVQIDGGARRGGNLFHSFSQFSIPTGGSAYFNNAADVQNIFSRVTGGSISNIDGVIRANGTANLFLLNPNGILFRPNARLNIGGSFVATTANSINFADNFQYSATNPQTAPLLTVSVPVGLQMGANPGRIEVQGNGYNLSVLVLRFSPITRNNSASGLRVPVGQSLALIGGDIDIAGGTLTAEQGHIKLGSVRNGQVSLGDGFTFSYPGVQTFGDIRLSRQALADASGGGSIQAQGNQVSLADGSLILVQNGGTQSGGTIRVNAAQSLELSGSSPDGRLLGGLYSETAGTGRGADITVSTQQLIAQSGAGTVTRSYSSGDAGNVIVNAFGSIQLIGFSSTNPTFASVIGSGSYSSGDGGTITVSTERLSVLDGATVSTATFGSGKGGALTVNAAEAVEIVGVTPLFTRSSVASNALNAGNAGVVTINTARLVLQNGGTVNTSTLATGNGGSVTINASEFVEVSSTMFGNPFPSRVGSSASIVVESLRQVYRLPDRPSGNSGSVTINTPRLNISNGSNIGVNNEGTGNAGTLQVNANSISLDRGSSITAATASGEGGNLDLNVRDFLLLRNNSQITTSARGSGNGGNIRINAGSIVAVPTENSDISANSVNARGGNITVNTYGIFGIETRSQDTPLSDITATGSTSAQQGTVQLNIDRLAPTAGLVALPTTVVDSSRLIAQGCPANQGNSFVITGRGGLPPTPEQQLDDDAEWQDRRRLTVTQPPEAKDTEIRRRGDIPNSTGEASYKPQDHSTPYTPVVEATSWQRTPAGKIILVANTSNSSVQNSLNYPNTCSRK
ncbi:MAG: S-layer family protein [Myxacorys chilensis ATA2-1-KO14]|jgi:filamentous hemagglutinin family protein|nr:S-layer family protein [Myxacorys chilensis ATA2-1-KO14]